jgi:hypothetical protein
MVIRRIGDWTPAVIPFGVLIVLLGAWAAVAPLGGPYFGFGFDTDETWVFSQAHWTLSLIPGIVAALAGLAIASASRLGGWLAGLVASAAGLWLVVGPALYSLWSSGGFAPLPTVEWKEALLWIGCFYGVGGLIVWLAAFATGLVSRRTTAVAEPADRTLVGPVREEPVRDREREVVFRAP